MTAVSRHTPHPPTLASTVLRPWKENKPNTILGNYRGRLYVWCSSHPPATCTVMFIFKPWSQRPTWLNSTQLAAELSCKEWSHHLGRCDHSHNSTKIVWFFVCRGVLNKFRISKTSWVESDRAAWSHEKLQLTNWVRSDASLFVTASVAIFNLSAISWTAFLFFILISVQFAPNIGQAQLVVPKLDYIKVVRLRECNDYADLTSLALYDFSVSK